MKIRLGTIALATAILPVVPLLHRSFSVLPLGKTGCPENAIAISNSQVGMKTASWTAECQGKTYFC